jgi:integrase
MARGKVEEMSATAVKRLRYGTVGDDTRIKPANRKNAFGTPRTAYYAVGGVSGLLLQCRPPREGQSVGSRSWILRVKVGTKRRDIGLGGYPDVTLSQARDKAREYREMIRQGIDPVTERQAARSALIAAQSKAVTFASQAKKYVEKRASEFKGRNPAKQRQRLETHLDTYVIPLVGKLLMQDLERKHVIDVLMQPDEKTQLPIWECKYPTTERIRQTIERIHDMAKAEGVTSGDNPAAWKGNLEATLVAPAATHKTTNQPTIGYERLPVFIQLLQERDTTPARALEFQILTAARPGEVQFAEWKEIDLEARLWTVPGHKIKNRKDHSKHHIVPLSNRAMEILEAMPRMGEYVFPGYKGKPYMSENALNNTVKDIHEADLSNEGKGFVDESAGRVGVAHGMRSAFKDFATEETDFPDDLSEAALSHIEGSETVKAAYKRKQMVEKRRVLMAVYERYAYTGILPKDEGGKVVSIGGGVA